MKIGLYFGSFNPIHHGHLIIANHLLSHSDLKEIWFVVSPQNPFKKSNSLLNEHHRYYLIQEAIEGVPGFKVSNVEFRLPKPSYTIDTLTYLSEKYSSYDFCIIMGSDSYQNLDKWKNASVISANYPIIIYSRPGFPVIPAENSRITIANAPLLEISSTYIRDLIRNGKSIQFLVPDKVRNEIELNNYYRSSLENESKNNAGENNQRGGNTGEPQ